MISCILYDLIAGSEERILVRVVRVLYTRLPVYFVCDPHVAFECLPACSVGVDAWTSAYFTVCEFARMAYV